ncbi:thiamine pyrophosphate-dependent dehydrogenase E1 component subunit alpha [Plantactinospora sp. CA-290183]|uniref:thiamine pyrophosphate-dependent dehydrogenase E1 component subunit alpha n=1 Tax=Plantactinospora sp. CA-290183 TaxID=3240006 RepID=UPI003D91D605
MIVTDDRDLDRLLLIRRFEENLLRLFADGAVAGTTHTCLGQEYIPVALAPLAPDAFVFSNHRGHGHYLAHCDDPEGLLAELVGRAGGVSGGYGGSQHLRRDSFVSTGIQGESLPAAAGVALHFKHTNQRRIVLVYIGDGTWGEGAVYEALNLIQLWRLPVLLVVEHNGIAQSTPTDRQMAGTVPARAAAFGIGCTEITTTDPAAIRAELAPHVDRVRDDQVPHVVVFHTVRLGPHSKGDDSRDPEELAALAERDWLRHYARDHPESFADTDARVRERIRRLTEDVLARPAAGDAW